MTDAEIIKALECCTDSKADCSKCPCFGAEIKDKITCELKMAKNALDLINRLQADKEALIAGQETLQKALAEKNAEVERFKKIETTVNEFWCVLQKFTKEKLKEKPTLEELLEYIEHAKAEAIKEVAERLKENTVAVKLGKQICKVITVEGIDYLVKEMVGDAE